MFEAIKVDASNQWFDPTAGQLAELLVFYDTVELITPVLRLEGLIGTLSLDDAAYLSELCLSGQLRIKIEQFPFGEIAADSGMLSGTFGEAKLQFDQLSELTPYLRSKDELDHPADQSNARELMLDTLIMNNQGRMSSNAGDLKAALRPIVELADVQGLIGYSAEELQKVAQTLQVAVSAPWFESYLIRYFRVVNGLGEKDAQRLATAFKVGSIDLGNAEYPRLVGENIGAGEYMGPVSLLCDLNKGEASTTDAYPHPAALDLMKILAKDTARKLTPDRDIEIFSDVELSGVRISHTIDSGQRTFRDIRVLLEQREPFIKVMRGKPADMSMAKHYVLESSKGFATRTTGQRLARFGGFTGVGVAFDLAGLGGIGTAMGVGLSALDSFVVDYLLKNKQANVFVDESLRDWLAGPGKAEP